jgi:dihydroxyacetone kinase-like protein
MTCAQAFTRASGSSFGTLLSASLLSAAKTLKGKTEAPWSDIPALLQGALDRMMALGNAHLGDKTVLDVLDASIKAMAGQETPAAQLAAGIKATEATIETMKALPNKIGRAGNMSERSIGNEDPGQVAFLEILRGLEK